MNDACKQMETGNQYRIQPFTEPRLESTTYKFAKCLQKRFGIIEGVTDKNYITNSYHVHVTEPIDAFSKLKFESQFQALSTGRSDQLRGGSEYAGQHPGCSFRSCATSMTTSCTRS